MIVPVLTPVLEIIPQAKVKSQSLRNVIVILEIEGEIVVGGEYAGDDLNRTCSQAGE